MLEIRCSESEAVMRMRGDAEYLHHRAAGLRRPRRKHSTLSNLFRNAGEKVEAAFDISMTRRVFSETRSVVGLSKGNAI